ncbi:type II and III secretion system protein family protein [Sphingomonas sp. PL-96]|nr:type II and III secretion system protein family protein [Sphingomonas sp. PL-96]MCC2976886.1 type II and III secretion system protein family protein [Sphingomonas sp. PL-96]
MGGSAPVAAQAVAPSPPVVQMNSGRGQLIDLPAAMTDVFVADDRIADVQVRSAHQLYVFGKTPGETTIHAVSRSGATVYAATVRVGNNITTVGDMLALAMPDAQITATPMNNMVLLTGTVRSPDDIAEAQTLAQAFVGANTQVLSRLKTATPMQVNLQVRIAEVSRSYVKNIGVNLQSSDTTGGFRFNIGQGRQGTDASFPSAPEIGGTFGAAGRLLGLDLLASLDLGERNGQVTTLANPNLTAISGETGTFLAGGEIPVPIAQGGNNAAISVEYKQYGVSLAYTPTVLSDGRITLRVRPEVSQITTTGAVEVNNITIPALTTRRAETTVELGSGQSFMIAGLLSNSHDNSISQTPFLANLPIIGSLFRSNAFQRNETELVIVITPYLVKPVDANQIVLPTDGYRAPNDAERVLWGQPASRASEGSRPVPTLAPPAASAPVLGAALPAGPNLPVLAEDGAGKRKKQKAPATPGFSNP